MIVTQPRGLDAVVLRLCMTDTNPVTAYTKARSAKRPGFQVKDLNPK